MAANILVIDDEPFVRQILFDILSKEGHRLQLAKSGEEGVSLFKQAECDLVFIDLGLPDLSGWQVVEAVKEHRNNVKVIVMTGWPEEVIGQALGPDKVQGILTKPFDVGTLLDLISEVTGQDC